MTDHKTLLGLFGDKPASPMASARVARWHMILLAYSYQIVHREGRRHQNANGLSRLPVEETSMEWSHPSLAELEEQPKSRINLLVDIDTRPVEAEEVKRSTKRDPLLTRVKHYMLDGWPEIKGLLPELSPLHKRKQN